MQKHFKTKGGNVLSTRTELAALFTTVYRPAACRREGTVNDAIITMADELPPKLKSEGLMLKLRL